ncbi:MAG: hypothetical protein JSR82_13025 [Verrucomicrobia bacterium]|nr:hypothetical protein [Verrucomicrobiota bacterium]
MPEAVPKISDWLACFGAYLRFQAGPRTGLAAIYADPQRALLGVADRSGGLLGFDGTAHEWPEPPPRPESMETGGDRGVFSSRLRKAFPGLGPRPAVRVLADAPGGSGIVMRFYTAGERVTIRSGALLRDTLEHNAAEIFAGLSGSWRWAVLSPDLRPAGEGESAHFLVAGLAEAYAAAVEGWTQTQGLILDEIAPAPLAVLGWLAERLPHVAAVGVLRSLRFRVVLLAGAIAYFELQAALEANAKSDPALAASATPGFSRNPDGSLNLDLTEQPILTVFRLLAAMERLNFIAPSLKGDERITLNLVRVSPRTAFQMIAAARGFRMVENAGVVTLERSDALSPQAFLTRTYQLRHARVAVVAQAVGNLLGIDLAKPENSSPAYPEPVQVGGAVGVTDAQARPRFTAALPMSERLSKAGDTSLFFTRRTNQLIIRATAAQHEQVAALLGSLDRDVPQIAMTCYVLEIADGNDQNTGIDWSRTLGGSGLRLGLSSQTAGAPLLKLSNALLFQGAVLSLADAGVPP